MLGPNGAGKTTTVRLLNGVLTPSSGAARVLGLDPATDGSAVRRRTGVLTESPSLYERLSARENLRYFGTLYGVPEAQLPGRVREQLELFGLAERADDRVGGFSKGMKHRLALARALLHRPEVLFLDEPTAGLDPEAARQVTALIEQLSHQAGGTVFLCTHNLAEAERLCHRVAVLDRGRALAVGTVSELSRALWRGRWVDIELATLPDAAVVTALRGMPGVSGVRVEKDRLAVQVDSDALIPPVVACLVSLDGQILRVNPREHSLEEIYFTLRKQRGEGAA